MTQSDFEARGGQVGFLGLLGITFIILKLTKVIDWSWWWVLAPLWGIPAIIGLFLVSIVLIMGMVTVMTNLQTGRSGRPKPIPLIVRVKDYFARQRHKRFMKKCDAVLKKVNEPCSFSRDLDIDISETPEREKVYLINRIWLFIKTWWTEGNKKAAEKKAERKAQKKREKEQKK